ncbi:GNAT family N-acetyltransferase [Flammeovirga pacifica]|uniref:N-acetyltransferase domain-containing protein n=1 Tax=Flammeovirga pacifica TaxID=915059 RepID=A0A1S1Z4W8_FLAPC|nr:GNAT family N-acetyltransferase [Flammeovirga pacifica]OHX68267.1 hypothetical protein NH26_18900 [Flammeovirga pacifica]
MSTLIIREIQKEDDSIIASIIKKSLEEHKANLPGTAYFDENLGRLSQFYKEESNSAYFIAEWDGQIVGGAGIGKIIGNTSNICELQKIYLSSSYRGKGIGMALMKKCLDFAKSEQYNACYLETMPQLVGGLNLYKKMGFELLDQPLGNTSHHACQIWMLKSFK